MGLRLYMIILKRLSIITGAKKGIHGERK
jgi:hypothetical protein